MPTVGLHEPFTIHASAARTATGTGTVIYQPPSTANAVIFILDVTAAANEAGDTLDVKIQFNTGAAGGEEWVDCAHFTQITGDGGAKTYVEKIMADVAEAGFETGSALGAGNTRNLVGKHRCVWTIADTSPLNNQSFTFTVTAVAC